MAEKTNTSLQQILMAIPPNFFSISFGLAGLANAWRLAGVEYGLSSQISLGLYILAGAVFLFLVADVLAKLALSPQKVLSELENRVVGPFYSLLPISGMLLSFGMLPYYFDFARDSFLVFFFLTVVLGGFLTGDWIYSGLDIDSLHSGYYLPTLAGGLIGGDMSARFGFVSLGWLAFGFGMICWLLLGSLVLMRLITRPPLPPALIPTLAIEVAPPVVAGNAYFTLTGGSVTILSYAFAGYAVLMLLVQLRLVPLYARTPFGPAFWSFTFSYSAVAAFGLRWISIELGSSLEARLLGGLVLGGVTILVGGIGIRSLVAIRQRKFLPAR